MLINLCRKIVIKSLTTIYIATFSWLRTWEELNLDLTTFPYVIEWLDKINQRPAVKKAILANSQPKNKGILA